MRKQLVIRLPDEWEAAATAGNAVPASWVLRDDERPAGSLFHGELKEAAVQAVGAKVTVLVPGADVVLAQVNLPGLKGQRLARAVPFALEEQLAEDVEDMHVAIGGRDAEGRLANAVISREKLEQWLTALKAAGLQPDVVTPELFGVPWSAAGDSKAWSLVVNDKQALLRTGEQTGLAFEAENIALVLQACIDAVGDAGPASLEVISCGENDFAQSTSYQALSEFCATSQIELSTRQADDACPVLLAQGFDEQRAINLLQGEFSRKEQLGKLLRPWRPALVLLAVWLVLQVGMLVTEYVRLSGQDNELREQIAAVYRQAFPDSRLVPGQEKLLMERGLEKLRGGGSGQAGMLTLLAQAGAVFKDTPGLQLRTLRYKNNQLDVDIHMPDLQALDKLKARLGAEAKLAVEIVSASSRDGKVESRLALKGGGA